MLSSTGAPRSRNRHGATKRFPAAQLELSWDNKTRLLLIFLTTCILLVVFAALSFNDYSTANPKLLMMNMTEAVAAAAASSGLSAPEFLSSLTTSRSLGTQLATFSTAHSIATKEEHAQRQSNFCDTFCLCALWKGNSLVYYHQHVLGIDPYTNDAHRLMSSFQSPTHEREEPAVVIRIVISHCKSPLDWLSGYTAGYHNQIASVHIISKCGVAVVGAPSTAHVITLPNVGRCDHTHAFYIDRILTPLYNKSDSAAAENSVIFFLKDDISQNNLHQLASWRDFGTMYELVRTRQSGFACGLMPSVTEALQPMSAYHDSETLAGFSMSIYDRNTKGYDTDGVEFKSQYANLSDWWMNALDDFLVFSDFDKYEKENKMPPTVEVCYGGMFAASMANIKRRSSATWKSLEKSLSRANNIQEGHFAERTWGFLLSSPDVLQEPELTALLNVTTSIYNNHFGEHGSFLSPPDGWIARCCNRLNCSSEAGMTRTMPSQKATRRRKPRS